MEQKIAELTEKLFKEGVEKGEAEKKSIVGAAQSEAERIRNEAEKQAQRLVAEARKQAEDLKKNIESEIKLSSLQAISSLKQKIADMLLAKTVDENVSSALSDPGFLKELIEATVNNWKFGQEQALEIVLPEALKTKLEKSLEKSLKDIMKKGATVTFSKSIKGGFQIGPSGASFKISLTDDDFNEFFKEYLRPRTRSFLFKE